MSDFRLDYARAINDAGEPATWNVVAAALRLGWIGPETALRLGYRGMVSDALDDQLVEIELAMDDGVGEAAKLILSLGQANSASAEAILHAGVLAQILDASLTGRQKLEEIASLWTDVGCPDTWAHLVYFNPMSESRRSEVDLIPEGRRRDFAEAQLLADARTYVRSVLPNRCFAST